MAYDRVVTDLNNARLKGTSFSVVHALINASLSISPDVRLASFSRFVTLNHVNYSPATIHANYSKFSRPFKSDCRTPRTSTH